MIYAVANLHGCYEKFKKLLKMIRFNDNDVMYILGDVVDFGEESIELVCDVSMRPNVYPIAGEHDLKAVRMLAGFDKMMKNGGTPDKKYIAEMTEWVSDGGQATLDGFRSLDADMKEGFLDYLSDMALFEEVEAGGKTYVLTHSGIADFDADVDLFDYEPESFMQDTDVNAKYFDDKYVVIGHVPTYLIEGAQRGKIYVSPSGNICIDCGAAFGEPLGCLRLDDGKEFYVE